MAKAENERARLVKCQIRLAIASKGVRVQVMASPESPAFRAVKVWPDTKDGKKRLLELPGGTSACSSFRVARDEDFWVEVCYGPADKDWGTLKVKYEQRKPYGYRPVKLTNTAHADLSGSVPRMKLPKR
jgi:hypothetical protein